MSDMVPTGTYRKTAININGGWIERKKKKKAHRVLREDSPEQPKSTVSDQQQPPRITLSPTVAKLSSSEDHRNSPPVKRNTFTGLIGPSWKNTSPSNDGYKENTHRTPFQSDRKGGGKGNARRKSGRDKIVDAIGDDAPIASGVECIEVGETTVRNEDETRDEGDEVESNDNEVAEGKEKITREGEERINEDSTDMETDEELVGAVMEEREKCEERSKLTTLPSEMAYREEDKGDRETQFCVEEAQVQSSHMEISHSLLPPQEAAGYAYFPSSLSPMNPPTPPQLLGLPALSPLVGKKNAKGGGKEPPTEVKNKKWRETGEQDVEKESVGRVHGEENSPPSQKVVPVSIEETESEGGVHGDSDNLGDRNSFPDSADGRSGTNRGNTDFNTSARAPLTPSVKRVRPQKKS